MNELQLKMIEVLEDTVQFYSEDVNRRGVINNGNGSTLCQYFVKGEDGCADKSCSVGRYLKPEFKNEEFSNNVPEGWALVIHEAHTSKLTVQLPQIFWRNLQYLHDDKKNWTSNGPNANRDDKIETIMGMIKSGEFLN